MQRAYMRVVGVFLARLSGKIGEVLCLDGLRTIQHLEGITSYTDFEFM
jgi:hypothetical protein